MRLVVSPKEGRQGPRAHSQPARVQPRGRARDAAPVLDREGTEKGVCCSAGSPACPRMTNVVSAKMNQTSCQVLGWGRGVGTKKVASTG